jgi:hypothetical protein
LVQNGQFRLQYGQQVYGSLAAAIEASQNEAFTTFSNFRDNAILIGILSVNKNATNLSDTTQARFLLTSKFGETVGAAGGISTTNLQQAYNNSATPEIVTNSAEGALSIQNGTGSADNITNLFEGRNTSTSTTSFIRADGLISGSSVSAPTISATTYQNLPTYLSATTLSSANVLSVTTGGGSPVTTTINAVTGGTYSNGTITLSGTGNVNGAQITGFGTGGSFTGGTVNGATNFTAGLTANTLSATTVTTSGDITASTFISSQSSGQEGGQINLSTSQTNNVLSGGSVSIDIFDSRFRIFESGSPNRGVYIELSATTAGVGTNLLSGGGGEVNTASNLGSGTGLFAQKSGVDLQFKSLTSTGNTVTITNNATTVNLEAES